VARRGGEAALGHGCTGLQRRQPAMPQGRLHPHELLGDDGRFGLARSGGRMQP
jgi:hypothetical protein